VILTLDFETRSPLDITEVGLDRYSRNAEVLMLAWAVEDWDVTVWFPHERPGFPDDLRMLLDRPDVLKIAHNCAFERAILKHCCGIDSPIEQWCDTSVLARYAGMPSKLADVSEFLNLGKHAKADGTRLITKFCKPNKKGSFNDHATHPEDWAKFVSYCRQDVIAEREVYRRLSGFFALPEREKRLWALDAKINERGIPVDLTYINNARTIVTQEKTKLLAELKERTNVDNPNSGAQLLPWLRSRGYPYGSLGEKKVSKALAGELAPEVRECLLLRKQAGKSSTAKLAALAEAVCT
jgi:DNA polymerase bacteriophage-type